MKKKYVKYIAIIIVILLVLAAVVPIAAPLFLPASASGAQSIYDEARKNREAYEKKLEKTRDKKNDETKTKAVIDTQINLLEDEISKSQDYLDELNNELNDLNAQSNVKKKEFDAQKEQFRLRIRAAYEQGPITYLDIILQSNNISEMLSRMDIISGIMDFDKKLCKNIKDIQTDIENKAAKQKELIQSQETAQKDKTDSENKLKAKQDASANLLETYKSDEKKYNELVSKWGDIEDKAWAEVQRDAGQSKGDYVGGTFLWPTPGYTKITCPFGMRVHPITGVYKMHTGVDIGAAGNSQVLAANGGKVTRARYSSALGNYVTIDHGGGLVTCYGHMNKLYVSEGQTVTRGQKIGIVGSTGLSTGNHLHFEVYENGKVVDPMKFFN